jgi:hypothetical protein
MTRVRNNIFVRGLSGKLADQFVLRTLRDGRTVVCKIPDFSNRKLSRDQKNHHKRFQAASAYAKDASRSNPVYARLAEGTMKNAYNVALGDWFHPPVIHKMERGSRIIRVQILNEKGKVIENGEGIKKRGDWWEYTPSAEGTVIVEVRDLAGNVVKAEV